MDTQLVSSVITPKVLKEIGEKEYDLILQNLDTLNLPRLVAPGIPTLKYLLTRMGGLTVNCFKVYFPVHFLMFLLRLKSAKKDGKLKDAFLKLAKGLWKSILFSVLYGMSMPLSGTFLRPVYNYIGNGWAGTLIATLFSTMILLESRGRLAEMSIYVLGQWLQGFSYSLIKRGYCSPIPHIEKFVFAFAFAIISSVYFFEDEAVEGKEHKESKSKIEVLISFVLGSKTLKY